jgi:hypothetical protein
MGWWQAISAIALRLNRGDFLAGLGPISLDGRLIHGVNAPSRGRPRVADLVSPHSGPDSEKHFFTNCGMPHILSATHSVV